MNIRFYNARILTMNQNTEILEGEVWVEGNRITHVGPVNVSGADSVKILEQPIWDREIDAKGNLIMPGFKNAHTHSAMTFLRSYADDMPLLDWLNKQIFPMEAKLQGEDIYWLSRLAILEYLTSGITANFDMYFYPEMIAKASVDSGFRTVIVSSLNDFSSSLSAMEEEYQTYNNYDELIKYSLGFHAEYTTSKKLLEGVANLSQKYKAPVFMHNSETESEVAQMRRTLGHDPDDVS